jgi:multiple sugar transport system permease protein
MKKHLISFVRKTFALAVVFLIFLPILLMLPSMLKTKYEIFAYPWMMLPKVLTFDNFNRVAFLHYTSIGVNFFQSLLMTILVASLAVIGSLFINMIAAFAFARLRFPGKKFIWPLLISTMFIPGITILLTSVKVVAMLGMLDTIAVLVIPGMVSAYNIFFFRQFYLGFPKELDEAAKIDGAKTYQIFAHIYFPMSKTPMVIIGASIFMGYYNSYLWPTLTISQDKKDLFQIMYLIKMLFNDYTTLGYGAVLAAAFVAMIPPLIIFIFVQRYIRDGIAISGLK